LTRIALIIISKIFVISNRTMSVWEIWSSDRFLDRPFDCAQGDSL